MDFSSMHSLYRRADSTVWFSSDDRATRPAAAAKTSSSPRPQDPTMDVTASKLLSTLIPIFLISGAMVLAFLVLRRTMRRQYAPRTFLATLREQERTPPVSPGMFGWIKDFLAIPDSWVLNHQSIDGYFLLRYLKISTIVCLVGCVITFPILFPVDATGGVGYAQLGAVTLQNIKQPNSPRLYAHVFVAWIFYGASEAGPSEWLVHGPPADRPPGFVWYMVAREMVFYINIRQAYLLSPLYANRMSSRTVLFTSVPVDFLDGAKIRRLFGAQLKNFWIATDNKELTELVKERDELAAKLEGAETKLIKTANANRLKAAKKAGGAAPTHDASNVDLEAESGAVAARYVTPKQRPTHKTKFLIGKKVDTINYCRAELAKIIPRVDALQAKVRAGETKLAGSFFVEFHRQADAQSAYQSVAHHQPLHMAPRYIGVNPEEVIWGNLRIKWWERVVRGYAVTAFVCALILFWALPVAFVGVLSNIDQLRSQFTWLAWMYKIPDVIFGVVSGLLPSVLLAVLMALLPIILRLAAQLSGAPSKAAIELQTQNYYFAFQVIQVFLVGTLASAATSVVPAIIANPSSAVTLLANKLPSAWSLYVSYFIVQGLTFCSGALLQIVGLILFRVLGKVLDSTPRKMYKRWTSLSGLGWGTVFPIYSLMIAIALIYAAMAPLVLLFATLGLWLMYIAFRYNLLFVFNANVDTKGLCYPRALKHTTVGIYIGEICLIGLFGISQAPGPTILMAAFLVGSILFHLSLNNAVGPLLDVLPRSLEVEEEHLLALENGASPSGGVDGHHHRPADKETGAGKVDAAVSSHPANGGGNGATALPPPHKKPGLVAKWLHPEKYTDYATLRRLVPRDFAEITYSEEVEAGAYNHPAATSATPMVWIPRDEMGISRQERAHTGRVLPCTDEGAGFDAKGKLVWDVDSRPPIYQEK